MKRNCVRNLVGMLMVLCIGITVMSGSATAANTTWSGYDEKDWVVAPVPASNLEGYYFISFSELES